MKLSYKKEEFTEEEITPVYKWFKDNLKGDLDEDFIALFHGSYPNYGLVPLPDNRIAIVKARR